MATRIARADIDGLRAVAVLSVVLYHYGVAGISGGFIGIDVLFAISGYLITRGIVRDLRGGVWSYAGFYTGRVRRLFPALFATLVLCYAAAMLLLLPEALEWFADTALHSAVGTSNLLYWIKTGYFGADPGYTPLLHTWSISVAAQLYLVWPLLLLALLGRRATRARVGLAIAVLALAGAASVWAGQAVLQTDARAAFYLMPLRLAAFAAGAMLVWLPRLPEGRRALEEWLLLAGLAILLYCLIAYDNKTPFPGVHLLLPTLGAALAVYAGQAPRVGRALRHPALVWVGLLSYSLYLVHWPLLGFARIWLLRPLDWWEKPLLILVALGLAWLMARLVERPFRAARPVLDGSGIASRPEVEALAGRHRDDSRPGPAEASASGAGGLADGPDDRRGRPGDWSPPAFGLACAGLVIALLLASALVLTGEGWPWRIPAEIRAPLVGLEQARHGREIANRVGVCHLNMWVGKTALGGYVDDRCMYIDPRRPNYLVLGDSHGGDRYAGLSVAYPEVNFLQMTTASCRPLLDNPFTDYQCPERMNYVFRTFLPRARLDGVILSGRWQERDLVLLRATLKHLRGLGHRVIVLGPTVEIFPWVPDLIFHHGRRAGLEAWVSRFILPERLDMDRRIRAMSAEEGAEYFSSIDALCPQRRCPVLSPDGTLLIVDYGHQSPAGALAQAQGLKRIGLELPRRQPVQAMPAVPGSPAAGP